MAGAGRERAAGTEDPLEELAAGMIRSMEGSADLHSLTHKSGVHPSLPVELLPLKLSVYEGFNIRDGRDECFGMTTSQSIALEDCIAYQSGILKDVSRTFALTIPELPDELRVSVGNAYLLCRIVDTIEDSPAVDVHSKMAFADRFIGVIKGEGDADSFARDLGNLLPASTDESEQDLVANTGRVILVTHSLNVAQRQAIERCVRIMSTGMMEFQRNAGIGGLKNVAEMDRYCYCVAGVVGEMLTELFCDYSSEIRARREELMRLSVSFGQGLQMTNILKDIWEDRQRGACWLPRDIFDGSGLELGAVSAEEGDPRLAHGIRGLTVLALEHLADALRYIQTIPVKETGIRRHCLWALGFAVLTLRRIYAKPSFVTGEDVKISRRSVMAIAVTTSLLVRSNLALRIFFAGLTRSLPRSGLDTSYSR